MKRIILSLAVAAMTATASAQPEPGTFSVIPRVGVAIANISNETFVYDGNSLGSGKYREGLSAGADLQYQATDMLALSLGVAYARQGCKYKDSDLSTANPGSYTGYSNVRNNLDYLNVPLMGHLYFAPGLSLNAGVQMGFLLHSSLAFDMADVTINKDGSYNIVFTSNKNPSQWREIFNEDDALLCALDRIFDDATVFTIRGQSYRGRKLEKISLQAGKVPKKPTKADSTAD